jgi:hypothetical protein
MTHGLKLLLAAMMVATAPMLTSCAKEPALKIAAGQDKNLFRKSDLLVGPKAADSFKGEIGKLAAPAVGEGVAVIEFDLSESFLTVWSDSKANGKALYQFAVVGHFDLAREKDKDGNQNQYLVKSKNERGNWNEREFVEVDPADVKKIKPTADALSMLYEVELVKSKEFVFGEESVPGIDQRLASDLVKTHGLVKGDKLSIILTKSYAIVRRNSLEGFASTIAYIDVEYVDLVRKKNGKEELTHEFERSSKERPWDQRQYVVLSPDKSDVASNDSSLVRKESIAGCRKVSEFAVPEVRLFLASGRLNLSEESEICAEISQTALSLCQGACSERSLLVTYDITDHLDIKTISSSSNNEPASKVNLWYDREYIRILAAKPQLTEYKVGTNALQRSTFDGEFVYVATVIASHSENGAFFEGFTLNIDSRLKFEFSENALAGYKLHDKLNTSGTKTPVVRYAADLFDVERQKNGYGDRTNVITENRDRPWEQRRSARVRFDNNQVNGYFNNFLGINNLYSNEFVVSSSSLVGEVNTSTPGLIYFDTEEILTPNARAGNFGAGETRLEPTTVTIRHAFLRVDQRKAPAKEYSQYDFRRFGLFLVDQYGLDENQRPTDDTLKHYARIFDISEDKQIVFALSPNFPQKYRDEAHAVIDSWNKAFKAATGRDNVMVLKENTGEHFGDPRTNMIVYFDQRNIAAPLGYGPTTSDPLTGESISAKSYLYGDSIRWVKSVAGDYFDLVTGEKGLEEFMNEGANGPIPSIGEPKPETGVVGLNLSQANALIPKQSSQGLSALAKQGQRSNYSATVSRLSAGGNAQIADMLKSEFGKSLSKIGAKQAMLAARDHSAHAHDSNHGCLYQADERIIAASKIVSIFARKGLTKEQVMDRVESSTVYTTLLHEVGHNLGLRHNFQGSFDEMNFHPRYFELKDAIASAAPGEEVESEDDYIEKYRTSSIMDYNDMFEANHVDASPYDVAAIKYAYGDKIEIVDEEASQVAGKLVTKDMKRSEYLKLVATVQSQVPDRSRLEIEFEIDRVLGVRPYLFCTDEHVENDPTCRRHDAGTTMAEITQNLIADYDVGYVLSGFRRNRRDFTGSSASVISRYVFPVRQLLDEYVYGIITGSMPESGPAGQDDYLQALNLGLGFFAKILNTPEPGAYKLDPETGIFVEGGAADGEPSLTIDNRVGKYLKPTFQIVGSQERVMRRGIELDKAAVLMALSMRGFPAQKYEQAGLAVNFFDLAKDFTLDIFSAAMRGKAETTLTAKEVNGLLKAITPDEAAKLPEGTPVRAIKVKPSTSLFVETYAMLFAMTDYNNNGDRSFGDYLDFRIVGEDDASLPSNVTKIAFSSPNGLRRYVVPQTNDGKSISFAIAQGADKKSDELDNLEQLANNPMIDAAKAKLVELLFDKVLAGYGVVFQMLQNQPLSPETVAQLSADKAEGIKRMLDVLSNVLDQIKTVREQAAARGDEQTVQRMDAFAASINGEKAKFICDQEIVVGQEGGQNILVPCAAESLEQLAATAEEAKDKIEDLRRELRTIESDLLHLRQLYQLLNR